MRGHKFLGEVLCLIMIIDVTAIITISINSSTTRQPRLANEDFGCGEHPWMDKKTLRIIQQAPGFELNINGLRELVPYLVQVSYDDGAISSRCAGTIISATEVITASACVPNDSRTANYLVRINNTWGTGQSLPVKRIIHRNSIINDSKLAVIELEKALVYSINGDQKIHTNRICSRINPYCGRYFHLSDEFKPRLVAPTWFHKNEFSQIPYLVSIMPNCQEGKQYWHMDTSSPKLMRGSPLVETNLYNSWLRGVYIGTFGAEGRPTFRAINSGNESFNATDALEFC